VRPAGTSIQSGSRETGGDEQGDRRRRGGGGRRLNFSPARAQAEEDERERRLRAGIERERALLPLILPARRYSSRARRDSRAPASAATEISVREASAAYAPASSAYAPRNHRGGADLRRLGAAPA
jgi:hypothetical protein